MKTYSFLGELVTKSKTIKGIKGKIKRLPSGEIVFLMEVDNDNEELLRVLYSDPVCRCKMEGTTGRTKVVIEDAYRCSIGRDTAEFYVESLKLVTSREKEEDIKEWKVDFFLSDLLISSKLRVALCEGVTVAFGKQHLQEKAELHGKEGDFVYFSEVASVTIPKSTQNNFEEALQKAKQRLDNLLLIVSFVQRKWVDWYHYSTFTGTQDIEYMRSYKRTQKSSSHGFVIASENIKKFFNNSVQKYVELLSKGIDLRLPLACLIGGHDVKYIDVRFLSYFISLEALLNEMANGDLIKKENISKEKFEELSCKIKRMVKEEKDKGRIGRDECENILNKVGDLNRQSVRSLTKQFLDKVKVKHDDLMDIQRILKFRNDLVHGRGIKVQNEFSKATFHLQQLLERSFLKVLGWKET